MTGTQVKMTCEDVREKIKDFVGDLLAESDYQAFFVHLDDCPKCTSYVRGMGSFSNQLWELGDIEVPSDLDSTILFQFKKAKDSPQPKEGNSKKLVFGGIVLAVVLFIAFGGTKLFTGSETSQESKVAKNSAGDDAIVIQAPVIKKKVSDPEAERLFKRLQDMAKSLEPVTKAKVKKEESEEKASEEVSKESGSSSSDKQPGMADAVIPDSYSLHWHISYLGEAKMKQLLNTIKTLDITLDYDDQDFFIFTTIGEKLKTLKKGIKFTNQVYLDLPDFILDGVTPNRKIPTSIYFGGRYPSSRDSDSYTNPRLNALVSVEKASLSSSNIFEWHALLVASRQDTLLNVIRKGGGTTKYTAKEAVVFSIPGIGLQALVEEMQSMGGIFIDFGKTDLEGLTSLSGTANVMIYFSKR